MADVATLQRQKLKVEPVALTAAPLANRAPTIGVPLMVMNSIEIVTKGVTKSTSRVHKLRARAEADDPLRCFRIWLRDSETNEIIRLVKKARPQDRDRELPRKLWRAEVEGAATQILRLVLQRKK
ncbi:hypothetical protein [Bradyrhizobium sp. McL0615]|uniref:hypothetical protein n=1 Tax=Bradyrhizobium sp. McL0615 TaxID=3415673 RepID=UPI003CF11193